MAYVVETLHQPLSNSNEVISFQADGDELEMVRQQFSNVPITKGNSCIWIGELAGFIFRNLVLPLP